MNTIHNAALLNQTGAAYLASNQPEQALKCFQTALEYVTQEKHTVFMNDASSSQRSIASTNPEESEGEYIYSKPFFFNPAASMTEEEIAPFGAVILFNLALSYHERSRTVGESALRMAMQLYDRCLSLLKHRSHFDCSNVILAGLHNQARIHEELCEHQMAGQKYKILSQLLERDELRRDTLETDDLEAICLNVFFFKFPICAPVA